MIVVSDTSAITSLLQIGRGELLSQVYGDVFIPEAVQRELLAAHPVLPAFLRVRKISSHDDYRRLTALVDEGEAEAIVLAKEINADELLIDEADGRRVAIEEGLQIVGLLGVLLEAKRRGLISSVRQLTGELENTAAFHVSDAVKEIIFRAAGEL
jgi:predicted nucleic acid-binding protein